MNEPKNIKKNLVFKKYFFELIKKIKIHNIAKINPVDDYLGDSEEHLENEF